MSAGSGQWKDALLAAQLMALEPSAIGGVVLRAPAGPARDGWIRFLAHHLPQGAPLRRVPLHISDERLYGGLDLAASLRSARPVAESGVFALAHGGVIVLAMAERISTAAAARFTAVLDSGVVQLERDAMSARLPARLGVVALDEGLEEGEAPPAALLERLAFWIDLSAIGSHYPVPEPIDRERLGAARRRLAHVTLSAEALEAVCATALVLGIASLRVAVLAATVARHAAALAGRSSVSEDDVSLACRLVLAPRATTLPPGAEESESEAGEDSAADEAPAAAPEGSAPEPQREPEDALESQPASSESTLQDVVLAATRAAIPEALLAQLKTQRVAGARAASGRSGVLHARALRGRPSGVRQGAPGRGLRLNLIETLRAAAPWQRVRQVAGVSRGATAPRHVEVRAEDFHVTRYVERTQTTTLFVVDASGSAALHRLSEAKGAVELLLAECYTRRDRVALLAFRGQGAELLLPPTRSLVRAKRTLAGLPGGGATPLAAAIDAAATLADTLRRRGDVPLIVFLTDARGNVARDGSKGRAGALSDAMAAAHQVRAARLTALLIDTAPQSGEGACRLADAMGARYLALPHADAAAIGDAARAARGAPGGAAWAH